MLDKGVEKELSEALASLAKLAPGAMLDIEMSWPPDDYSITFLAWANGEEVSWDHRILSEPWAERLFVEDDYDEEALEELDAELLALFRRCWKSLGRQRCRAKAYLRKHDDIQAHDLTSGTLVQDSDRADLKKAEAGSELLAGDRGEPTEPKVDKDLERVRPGASLEEVKNAYGLTEDPNRPISSQRFHGIYDLPDRGLKLIFNNEVLEQVTYCGAFEGRVSGVWVGAHPWEVHERLGPCDAENASSYDGVSYWLWRYGKKGLTVKFDDASRRVDAIMQR